MRIIVAGSRSFTDYSLLKRTLDCLTRKLDKKKLTILSGHTKGADRLGERWAFENFVNQLIYHKPETLEDMVDNADALMVFDYDESNDLTELLVLARKTGLKVKVILFEE